ncbi:MAG: PD-(D/E)XK nuclease family protein [Chloroflexi bacterium]|nr:PD-(D/E)XK nuclease family protein [Chloroflexota bacterium]
MSAWSFSGSRLFRKCPRQWYLKTIIAEPRSKDPIRREAYLLSKLQTIYSWRGSLVDWVILMRYIPTIKRGQRVVLGDLLKYAREIFNRQLEFGLANRLREPGMKVTETGDAFAAFLDVEYGDDIAKSDIEAAWEDVKIALTNLVSMKDLQAKLESAIQLIPQRSLTFTLDGIKATGQPDLMAFFADQPPLIVDWKVHTYASSDYRLQLALYALALTNCRPHSDFPKEQISYQETEIQLLEVQLLTNELRKYHLASEDFDTVSDYMARSALNMEMTIQGEDGDIAIDDLPVTLNDEECQRCPFRSMCWFRG